MNPFIIAMIEFAILGTLGEFLSNVVNKKKNKIPKVIFSMLVWAILGVLIKFMLTGFTGFVDKLIELKYLPSGNIWSAIFKSFFMNAFFGPWIVILHRFFDGLYCKKLKINMSGINKAFFTLVWFWLPAHSITFALPIQWQSTLAAVWSFVLGLLLGLFYKESNIMKEKKEG